MPVSVRTTWRRPAGAIPTPSCSSTPNAAAPPRPSTAWATATCQGPSCVVASTEGMVRRAVESPATTFIVATEVGIIHRMNLLAPAKRFLPASEDAVCPYMKKITLESVAACLERMEPRVTVPEPVADAGPPGPGPDGRDHRVGRRRRPSGRPPARPGAPAHRRPGPAGSGLGGHPRVGQRAPARRRHHQQRGPGQPEPRPRARGLGGEAHHRAGDRLRAGQRHHPDAHHPAPHGGGGAELGQGVGPGDEPDREGAGDPQPGEGQAGERSRRGGQDRDPGEQGEQAHRTARRHSPPRGGEQRPGDAAHPEGRPSSARIRRLRGGRSAWPAAAARPRG